VRPRQSASGLGEENCAHSCYRLGVVRERPGGAADPGFGWALGLGALALLGLYMVVSHGGFGGTSDSFYYLAAARGLRAGGPMLGADGTPYRFWGPLYPALLAVFASPNAIRWLHGAALLAHLALWSWAGRFVLGHRSWVLPLVVALSTAVLVPAKFIWAETVFVALVAAYCAALIAWLCTRRGLWLALATGAGFLLALQRTSGVFLLAGAVVGLLMSGAWRDRRWLLLAHGVGCCVGVLGWSYYAALAGPAESGVPGGWLKLLNTLADYGFVLARWFGPLATGWRGIELASAAGWALVLVGLLAMLWPHTEVQKSEPMNLEEALRLLWWMVVADVLGHVVAVTRTRAGAGLHDTERYLAALVGPVLLLALARWPAAAGVRWRQLLNGLVLAAWLGYSALRVGHNVAELRHRPPIAWPMPKP
jgi:hypothetical protein